VVIRRKSALYMELRKLSTGFMRHRTLRGSPALEG
jgi:hypothetical protein